MGTTTTNYGLYKPTVGETGWGAPRNASYDAIDLQLFTNTTAIALNTAHAASNGSSHTFIDQDVTIGSSPTFDAINITGVTAAGVSIVDSGAFLVATDVEAAFQEIMPEIDANTAHAIADGKSHADVVLNNTHRASDGKDHSDVLLNNTHRTTTHDYGFISGNDAATDVTAAELEELTDGTVTALHSHAGVGTDEFVQIDAVAAPGYIGAAAGDGVLRSDATIDYTDGGDFVTLGLADTAVTPGAYTTADITVDQQGRITAAASGAGGGGATLDQDVTQANAFSVGEWIYHNGTTYELADASAAATAESIGIVTAATGADFTVQFGGYITGLSGLTAGEAHFLSETPGAITATAPSTEDSVIKPVLVADSATTGYIFNMRGIAVTSTTSFFQNIAIGAGLAPSIAHNLGHTYVICQVYDENDDLIQPDDITLTDANNLVVDLTSYGVRAGAYTAVILDIGTTTSSVATATDLDLTGQAAEDVAIFDGTNWVAQGGTELVVSKQISRIMTDPTAVVPYTGFGFKPKYIQIVSFIPGTTGSDTIGYASGAGSQRCKYRNDAVVNRDDNSLTQIIKCYTGVSAHQAAIFASFDVDGFTLSWTKTNLPTGTMVGHVTAWR